MFTLVKSILLKPLAYPEPDRLVRVIQNSPYETANHPSFGIAPLEFLRWRKEIRSFESMALLRGATVNLTGAGAPEVLGAARRAREASHAGNARTDRHAPGDAARPPGIPVSGFHSGALIPGFRLHLRFRYDV